MTPPSSGEAGSGNADKLCIDLCCGRKGFSRAFVEAGWEVVTVDIEPKYKPTVCMDIREVLLDRDIETMLRADSVKNYSKTIVLASPPCERFSIANRMFPKPGIRRALEIVGSVYELIAEIRPNFWVVENPKGRLRWFLGTPNLKINLSDYGSKYRKPTDLWTNVVFPMIQARANYVPSLTSKQNGGNGSTGLLRIRDPAARAEMPLGLSQAILTAVEEQARA